MYHVYRMSLRYFTVGFIFWVCKFLAEGLMKMCYTEEQVRGGFLIPPTIKIAVETLALYHRFSSK